MDRILFKVMSSEKAHAKMIELTEQRNSYQALISANNKLIRFDDTKITHLNEEISKISLSTLNHHLQHFEMLLKFYIKREKMIEAGLVGKGKIHDVLMAPYELEEQYQQAKDSQYDEYTGEFDSERVKAFQRMSVLKEEDLKNAQDKSERFEKYIDEEYDILYNIQKIINLIKNLIDEKICDLDYDIVSDQYKGLDLANTSEENNSLPQDYSALYYYYLCYIQNIEHYNNDRKQSEAQIKRFERKSRKIKNQIRYFEHVESAAQKRESKTKSRTKKL